MVQRPTQKKMAELINEAKNKTKHKNGIDDSAVNFDPKSEAYELLDRALDNYYNLMSIFGLQETELMRQFNRKRRPSLLPPEA